MSLLLTHMIVVMQSEMRGAVVEPPTGILLTMIDEWVTFLAVPDHRVIYR